MGISKLASRAAGRVVLSTKKNSPHILFGAGVVGAVGATVLACRATLRLSDTVDDFKKDIESAKADTHAKSSSEYQRDLAYAYGRGTGAITRLYAPAVAVGGVSLILLTSSHVQLTRRNAALSATVTALTSTLKEYRKRVREEIGDEREFDLFHNVQEFDATDEKGKKYKVKTLSPDDISPYARIFDDLSNNWVKDREANVLFVRAQQNYYNQLLRARGHVFLNEVYDALDIPRTRAGQCVGWVWGSEEGDGYVDFGLFSDKNAKFLNGLEDGILLDFNVDGDILGRF